MGQKTPIDEIKTKVDPLYDWQGFYQEIQDESPRAAVIISAAFLDAQLRNLISKTLIDDRSAVNDLLGTEKNSESPLSSFSSRIKAAYCMGLISRIIYQDLLTIKKIRNKFAHAMHGYTFDEPQIIKWCSSLNKANEIIKVLPRVPNTHRNMFLLGVTQLITWIALRTLEIEQISRPYVPNRIQKMIVKNI